MSTPIDESTVRHIARLARLSLTNDETTAFSTQLAAIVEYVRLLERVDTTEVPPNSHALPLSNVLREDEPAPPLEVQQVLANAPRSAAGFFVLPKVLET